VLPKRGKCDGPGDFQRCSQTEFPNIKKKNFELKIYFKIMHNSPVDHLKLDEDEAALFI
jgi:hypothetical protein